ncbi:3779_t:CDS:2 [Rhizophagus irregularis]|nr:3779_t:CDS:2 [Rhizophagus irregularis]
MDQIKLKPPPGHVKSPLLQMIPLKLKTQNQFNDLARAKILAKMRRISILFNFWQEQGTQNWSYTSLMGGDKEKVLKNFNFRVVFAEERAFLINQLWRNFYELYNNMKSQKINPSHFADQAKQWLDLFLTPFQVLCRVKPDLLLYKALQTVHSCKVKEVVGEESGVGIGFI